MASRMGRKARAISWEGFRKALSIIFAPHQCKEINLGRRRFMGRQGALLRHKFLQGLKHLGVHFRVLALILEKGIADRGQFCVARGFAP